MKRPCLLLLCLAFAGCGPCHSHLIGLVLDAKSGEPIESAEVRLQGVREGPFYSDDEGYVVADAPCSTEPYTVTISAMGYREEVHDVLLEGHEREQTVKLTPLE